ncbi:Uncharacterized protein BM_BM17357 [Brugia malayi]|uniref:Uncharacterized protein n=1 Tax=Brugia malayi TaxID=6279 RepID=A0A4E9F3U3_BRUMA|nr:Uncharacterized protein BM_BM17357 [Brugia malayi]VIO90623.1 Uncharacterized protein BM_BM17357 [Brugia malayi]
MSATIVLSARPAKEKLEALLKEVQEMDLTPSEQMLTREETRQQHEARKRIIEAKIMRLKLHIGTLETINANWVQCIQQVLATKRKEEEDKYVKMVEDKRATERILRQLEAIGENLEQSNIEIIIENKLPAWILDRVYQQKEQEIWSVAKLRHFLVKLIQRNEEVTRSQSLDIMKEKRETKSKIGPLISNILQKKLRL